LLDAPQQLALKRKQADIIRRLINEVLNLTSSIRARGTTAQSIKDLLFIYETASNARKAAVIGLNEAVTSLWCKQIVRKYDLRSDHGAPLQFNLVRFRSTKLTAMAIEGRDFFEIQQVARHKSVRQTVKYVDQNKLDAPARKIVFAALERIHENRALVSATNSPGDSSNAIGTTVPVFHGLIADCRNVFDPPKQVRNSVEYTEGQACTRFNICLFCRNVVVMREHLPALVAYRTQILAMKGNNIQNLPHSRVYDHTLAVIDQLLDVESGEFSAADVEWATEAADALDIVVDPLLYQGVES